MSKKIALVTGAGSGIGKATAQRLAKDGYHVVLNDRARGKLQETADAIGTNQTLTAFGDISKEEDVRQLIEQTIEAYGRLDVLVNNAGVFVAGKIEDLTLDDWNQQIGINVTGTFLVTKHALPHLKKQNGAIVNVSSVSGMSGDWGALAYNTSKGAVTLFTKSLALDLADAGVRVNAVAPSLVDTPLASSIMEDEEKMKKFKQRIAMGRPAQPEEVADVIAFLASKDARFVTGTIVTIDGGLTASNGQPPLD